MTNPNDRKASGDFNAIDRTVVVIEAIRQQGSSTLAEISRAAELSEPTVLRYLSALRKHHLVSRDPKDGRYQLGVRLHDWGAVAPSGVDPRAVAELPLAHLVEDLGETVELSGVDGRQLVVLAARPGAHAVSKVARVGEVELWHSTSVGKAILGHATSGFVDDVLAGISFPRLTSHTLDSEQALREDLDLIRQRGYALDDEESEDGLRCVGVAVRDRRGEYRYAISVSGPAYRMTPERDGVVAGRLHATAQELERALGLAPMI